MDVPDRKYGYSCPCCDTFIPADSPANFMRECPHCKAEIIDQLRVMRAVYKRTGEREP